MTKKYLMVSMFSVLIMLIGVSVAYFAARIEGSGNNITLGIKTVTIAFTDSAALSANNVVDEWNTTKTFTVQNNSEEKYKYNIVIKDLINTYGNIDTLQYRITSTNGGYSCDWTNVPKSSSASTKTIGVNASINAGVTQSYTLYLRYLEGDNDPTEDIGKTFSGKLGIEEYVSTKLVNRVLSDNPTRLTRSDFDTTLTTDNTGTLYTTTNTEDGSTVYYFAGNALNNWVKFGKCTSASYNCTVGEDLYWRIIRTNTTLENGGVRLLYAGSGSVANQNAYIDSGTYWSGSSSLTDNPMYAGYMWGTSGSLENNRTNQTVHSNTPAEKISSWYTATFNNNSDNNTKDSSGNLLTDYISPTAIYCNDRSIGSGTYSMSLALYGSFTRGNNFAPSLTCGATTEGYGHYFEGGTTGSLADKFTGSTTNASGTIIGNGLLTSTPAALITFDEIIYAGGLDGFNAPTWYYYNAASTPGSIIGTNSWWTMSPSRFYQSLMRMFAIDGSVSRPGYMFNSGTGGILLLRPAISLKADVLWTGGDGSPSNPYEVEYKPTLVDKVLELNPTRLTRTSFDGVLTSDNTGTLYTTTNTEDGSTVYYFAGNALNNWVKFGKCTSTSYNCTVGDDLYWRIIRTNETIEDGGVRLLYAGSGSVANQNAYIGSGAYNANENNPMYVGYMWGTTGSLANNRTNQTNKSNVATTISSWYTATFNNNSDNNTKDSSGTLLTNYISPTAIYCNDRSVGSGSYSTSSSFDYGGYTRLYTNKTPSLACGANTSGYGNYFEGTSSIADKFTGSAKNSSNVTIGNRLLESTPAALITADEIAFAGGKYGTNAQAWYYYNAASTPGSATGSTGWWTMSPYRWSGSYALVFFVYGSAYPGYLSYGSVSASRALRPVVSLKSEVLCTGGDGSANSPFVVKLD